MSFDYINFLDENSDNDNLSIISFKINDIQNIIEDKDEYLNNYTNEYLYINQVNKEEKIPEIKYLTEINKSNFKTTKSKNGTVFKITKENKENNLGRKKTGNLGGKHNKFSIDNLIRKIKSKLLTAIISYLKEKIKENSLQNKIGCISTFVKTDQKYIQDTKISFNLKLTNTKLKDILSDNISVKYKNLGIKYNKKLVKKIYRGKKHKKIVDILEATFCDCLEQVRGRKYFENLKGLEEEFRKVVDEMKETEKYFEAFKDLLNKFEIHFKSRRAREKFS